MELTLIRHGESTTNVENTHQTFKDPLTSQGKSQAEQVRIKTKFDKIFSSDMPRALETAKIIFPSEKIIVDSRIQEKRNGIFEGISKDKADWTEVNKAPFMKRKAEGGESLEEVKKRVISFLSELDDGKYAIISHGTILRVILAITLKKDLEEILRNVQLGNASVIAVTIKDLDILL